MHWSAPHGMHAVDPFPAVVEPGGQGRHAVSAATVGFIVPAGQSSQNVPNESPYIPLEGQVGSSHIVARQGVLGGCPLGLLVAHTALCSLQLNVGTFTLQ